MDMDGMAYEYVYHWSTKHAYAIYISVPLHSSIPTPAVPLHTHTPFQWDT